MLDRDRANPQGTKSTRRFRMFPAALLPLLLCLLAPGCGQKGDLYLPGKSQTLASGPG